MAARHGRRMGQSPISALPSRPEEADLRNSDRLRMVAIIAMVERLVKVRVAARVAVPADPPEAGRLGASTDPPEAGRPPHHSRWNMAAVAARAARRFGLTGIGPRIEWGPVAGSDRESSRSKGDWA